jgi:LPXTG-motif cell wall-anchored protein
MFAAGPPQGFKPRDGAVLTAGRGQPGDGATPAAGPTQPRGPGPEPDRDSAPGSASDPAPHPAPDRGPAPARKPLFTGAVRRPSPALPPALPPASAMWRGWPEVRADLRSSAGIVLALALTGIPAGLLWWWLAPRADFRVTETGPVVVGSPSEELLVADDAVLVLVLAGVGLLAGSAAWFLRRRRGVATLLALALGGCLTGVVAWQLGELLGAAPTEAQLADVGARVTTSLTLGSLTAMAIAPFTALLAYIGAVLATPLDGLGRVDPEAVPPAWGEQPAGMASADNRALVDVPPPGRPSA